MSRKKNRMNQIKNIRRENGRLEWNDVPLSDERLDTVLAVNLKLSVPKEIKVSEELIQRTLDGIHKSNKISNPVLEPQKDPKESAWKEYTIKPFLRYRKALAGAAAIICLAFVGGAVMLNGGLTGYRTESDRKSAKQESLYMDMESGNAVTTGATMLDGNKADDEALMDRVPSATFACSTNFTSMTATEASVTTAATAAASAATEPDAEQKTTEEERGSETTTETGSDDWFAHGKGAAGSAVLLQIADQVSIKVGETGKQVELTEEETGQLAAILEGTGRWIEADRTSGGENANHTKDGAVLWQISLCSSDQRWRCFYSMAENGILTEEISKWDSGTVPETVRMNRYELEDTKELTKWMEDRIE